MCRSNHKPTFIAWIFYLAKNNDVKSGEKKTTTHFQSDNPNHFACSEQFHKISTRNILERAAHNDQISCFSGVYLELCVLSGRWCFLIASAFQTTSSPSEIWAEHWLKPQALRNRKIKRNISTNVATVCQERKQIRCSEPSSNAQCISPINKPAITNR